MFKNYIKIAFRNLWRQKGYNFLNIAGLAIGISVCITIFMWIQVELKHDGFHENSDRIYRSLWDAKVGDNEWTIPAVPVPVGETLVHEFPEVEQVTNLVVNSSQVFKLKEEFVQERDIIFADEAIFDVFTFQFIAGNPETALQKPNSIVLTDETARRYFGNKDALGQNIEQNNGETLQVTGVVKKWPAQTHLTFNFIKPISTLKWVENRSDDWGSATVRTYFLLRESADINSLQNKFDEYVQEKVATADLYAAAGNYTRFPSQALTDIHLRSRAQFGMDSGGDIRYITLFAIIGLFILALGCINFINLTTARSVSRMREIGVRKVLGSLRSQLMHQFLAESFLYVLIAVIFALLLTELTLPFF